LAKLKVEQKKTQRNYGVAFPDANKSFSKIMIQERKINSTLGDSNSANGGRGRNESHRGMRAREEEIHDSPFQPQNAFFAAFE